ncbi:hypothetical protein J2X31_002590 [Flavobacterium arsenatis]|uniref:YcxB-like protein domain-containing protein n=1 Tax=Flavobacterium arsenatis TaxID=1484332 RepID=A0ABU1TRS0_9FLAO|nr:hypothetical protein [Flavobacterium arsenatis]
MNYKLKENYYLQLQLYFAKDDGRVRKQIIRGTFVWFIILSVFSIFAFRGFDNPFSYFFPLAALLSLIFSPYRIKESIFKNYQEAVKVYKNEFGKDVNLKIDDVYIYLVDIDKEVKFKIETVETIIETGKFYYIKLQTNSIFIPKDELEDVNQIKEELLILSQKLNVNYKSDLDWKW